MADELQNFKEFLKHRETVGESYVRGDAQPLGKIVTKSSPAMFFAPKGGFVQGADTVWATYEKDAGAFLPQSTSEFEILQMGASGGIGYWTGFQRAQAYLKGSDKPVPFHLRITEVFRYENGEWKLVHRHADPLAEEQKSSQ